MQLIRGSNVCCCFFKIKRRQIDQIELEGQLKITTTVFSKMAILYFYYALCPLDTTIHFKSLLLLSHHHSTSALVSEILESVLQTVQKNKTIYI